MPVANVVDLSVKPVTQYFDSADSADAVVKQYQSLAVTVTGKAAVTKLEKEFETALTHWMRVERKRFEAQSIYKVNNGLAANAVVTDTVVAPLFDALVDNTYVAPANNQWVGTVYTPTKSSSVTNSLMAVLKKVVLLPGLAIEVCGCWIWVTGNTFPNRQALGAAGFSWSKRHARWYWGAVAPIGNKRMTYPEIQQNFGVMHVDSNGNLIP